ncbi:response regulator [Chitinophaga arvensicola]|uniref:DNA-binding response regulator, NarL/FixJ family, contains REC and HTH domains n=1 Tax=Chitinophaga arvensicola TaxID=29529 RepID=A0A1I0S882_9BACT|nr:response regulator transcription factor [Chitinophaga arvensicola]SEW52049.1 DNA-binding response regulator, NarL/FixJ family, contains REC and HTH domains [Chitinophaga arvensicola]
MIRIYFVDDHPLILEGLRSLLSGEEDIQLTGETRNGISCLRFLDQHTADVVLLDTLLPDISGAELCANIKKRYPDIAVLGLSYHKNDTGIAGMLDSGASGCLMKNADKEELLRAIHDVYSGHTYLSAELKQALKTDSLHHLHITKREKEVLWLIANGHTNHEIAEKLFISADTVDSHRRNLLGKFNARNTAMLIKCAVDNKVLI